MKIRKIRLAEIFQNKMMLQRDKKIVVWGFAEPGMTITAALYHDEPSGSRLVSQCRGKADCEGAFSVALVPHEAGKNFSLAVGADGRDDVQRVVLKDICFGDIYLAAGQSNMEFFLKYDRDWERTKELPRNPDIRMYNTPQRAFDGHDTHNRRGYGFWFDDSDPVLETFSAPAYSFARELQKFTGIPVGIVGCNWGGTTASAWVPEKVLAEAPLNRYLTEYEAALEGKDPEELAAESLKAWAFEDSAAHAADFEPLIYGRDRAWQLNYMKEHASDPVIPMGPYNINRPGGLFEHMLAKLLPFSLKGVLWYQGESDAGDRAFMYDRLLTALIETWRAEWNDRLPFLVVQLAPFGEWLDCDGKGYDTVRAKQAYVARTVPDVYITGIMDLGSYYDIHPKEKMEVGRRLALLAMGHIYGESSLLCDAPEAVGADIRPDGRIVITLRHADGLCLGEQPSDWEISNGERAFRPSDVQLEDQRLILTLPDDFGSNESEILVSLGRKDYAEIHIRNRAGLTVLPFTLRAKQGLET